jgi:hypothetical protein
LIIAFDPGRSAARRAFQPPAAMIAAQPGAPAGIAPARRPCRGATRRARSQRCAVAEISAVTDTAKVRWCLILIFDHIVCRGAVLAALDAEICRFCSRGWARVGACGQRSFPIRSSTDVRISRIRLGPLHALLSRATPSAVSDHYSEFNRLPNLQVHHHVVSVELRPLPSTGITGFSVTTNLSRRSARPGPRGLPVVVVRPRLGASVLRTLSLCMLSPLPRRSG